MADVFLSYKRDDEAAAGRLVRALRAGGLSVWWDQDIAPAAPWEATIEHELEGAKAVIVAWSRASAASENVKAEARRARHKGKLIQVFIEPCDPPLFFGEHQGLKLAGWTGDVQDSRFQTLLAAARAVIDGKAPPSGVGYARREATPWAGPMAAGLAVIVALGVVAGLIALNPPARRAPAAPASPAPSARALLLAKVAGVWGLPAEAGRPACQTRFAYRVERRGPDDVIRLRGLGVESVGRVVSAEGGSIFTRTLTPAAQAGTQWELRLEGDRLIQVDASNVSTTLVKCAG
jgi:hypothetical protein